MTISINSCFDGGNIECLQCDSANNIRLKIKPDAGHEFFQWFYFRLSVDSGTECTMRIENASDSSYPKGWDNYHVVASYDREDWFRLPTRYENGQLVFSVTPETDVMWFAYFTPYSMEQHQRLIAKTAIRPNVSLESLGTTIDGRSVDMLRIGDPQARLKIWAIARQHPGETMAQWWMEGYLSRLTDSNQSVSRQLLRHAVFYVVPNMNPDGSARGYLRTNSGGTNLNREWNSPSLERSPEVYFVRQKMHETGVDFSLDVHGDEALPYNFIAGTEGVHSWNSERLALQNNYKNNLEMLNPDFQTIIGYPVTPAGAANYGICSSYVAENFNCPAMTLEMPFKDTVDTPNSRTGWSAQRSALLGQSCLDAVYSIIEQL